MPFMLSSGARRAPTLTLALFLLATPTVTRPAWAADFAVGGATITSQITLSAGFGIRAEGRDPRLICPQNLDGGTAVNCNGDDGDLNFDSGDFISQAVRAQGEATIDWRNFTAYVRGQAFYDFVYADGDLAYQGGNPDYVAGYRDSAGQQTDAGRNAAAYDYEMMDLWLRGTFDLGKGQLIAKVGQQSISWGEALFSPLSLSQVNSLDQAKLHQPGAELRDATRSMPAALLTLDIGTGTSVETFYQFEFRPSQSDSAGSYFSTNDVGGVGGAGTAAAGDYDTIPPDATDLFAGNLSLSIPRSEASGSSDGANWGIALRHFASGLNNTEFAFYFANITARSPVPVFTTPSEDEFITQADIATDPAVRTALADGAADQYAAANPQASAAEVNGFRAAVLSNPAALTNLAIQENAANSTVTLVNPDNVQMLGVSFNTSVDALGLAVAGEAAWMHDLPVLIDGGTTAQAAACALFPSSGIPCGSPLIKGYGANQLSTLTGQLTGTPDTQIEGFTREDVYTFVFSAAKQFGATDYPASAIGASGVGVSLELGGAYVDLPDDEVLAYEAPGNGLPGAGNAADPLTGEYEAASDLSLGITAVVTASYPDAFAGVNLTPGIRFSTGLYGNTPVTGGYVEHASALSFGVDAAYLLAWRASIGYTVYFGGGAQNPLIDRDYFAVSASYTF